MGSRSLKPMNNLKQIKKKNYDKTFQKYKDCYFLLGVCFGTGCESGAKSRETLNTKTLMNQ